MTIFFSGDFNKLDQFAATIAATPRELGVISSNLAEESITLIADGFRAERDPYGHKWKKNLRGGKVLSDRGTLRSSWNVSRATRSGFAVASGVFYAAVHQGGKVIKAKNGPYLLFKIGKRWVRKKSVKIPQRMMIPTVARGIPTKWAQAFNEVVDEVLGAHFA